MANYGASSLIVEVDTTQGGSLSSGFSQYVREINGLKVEALLVESHSFGDTWFESLWTGIKKADNVTIRGLYNDTASTGPNAIFCGHEGEQRSVSLTWGGTKVSTFEAMIVSYNRMPKLNDLTMYEVVLRPTGAVSEA